MPPSPSCLRFCTGALEPSMTWNPRTQHDMEPNPTQHHGQCLETLYKKCRASLYHPPPRSTHSSLSLTAASKLTEGQSSLWDLQWDLPGEPRKLSSLFPITGLDVVGTIFTMERKTGKPRIDGNTKGSLDEFMCVCELGSVLAHVCNWVKIRGNESKNIPVLSSWL